MGATDLVARRGLAVVIGAALVAGCDGGDGDTVVALAPALDGPNATFGQIRNDFADKFALHADPFPSTDISEMPVFGSATYAGSAVHSNLTTDPVAVRASPTRASRGELTADFTAAEVTGRLYNFRSADPATVISGELPLNGIISANRFAGGAFVAPGGVRGILVTNGVAAGHSGAFSGRFAGSDYRAVEGLVAHSTPATTYAGVFVGAR